MFIDRIEGCLPFSQKSENFGWKSNGSDIFRKIRSENVEYCQRSGRSVYKENPSLYIHSLFLAHPCPVHMFSCSSQLAINRKTPRPKFQSLCPSLWLTHLWNLSFRGFVLTKAPFMPLKQFLHATGSATTSAWATWGISVCPCPPPLPPLSARLCISVFLLVHSRWAWFIFRLFLASFLYFAVQVCFYLVVLLVCLHYGMPFLFTCFSHVIGRKCPTFLQFYGPSLATIGIGGLK